jgi:hypothetical protein
MLSEWVYRAAKMKSPVSVNAETRPYAIWKRLERRATALRLRLGRRFFVASTCFSSKLETT